jgi:hypothetical protein
MRLKNGNEISKELLQEWDKQYTNVEIANKLGISRMGLHKLRIRLDCKLDKRKPRTDKGNKGCRTPIELQKANRAAYMRQYRKQHPERCKYVIKRKDKNSIISEHRLIMEQHLGRKLKSNEVVHHIDGNPQNNAIENLHLCTQKEHILIHKGYILI